LASYYQEHQNLALNILDSFYNKIRKGAEKLYAIFHANLLLHQKPMKHSSGLISKIAGSKIQAGNLGLERRTEINQAQAHAINNAVWEPPDRIMIFSACACWHNTCRPLCMGKLGTAPPAPRLILCLPIAIYCRRNVNASRISFAAFDKLRAARKMPTFLASRLMKLFRLV